MVNELKPASFIPPAVALVVAGVWIGSQRHSISNLEEQSSLLEKHIAAARSSGSATDPYHAKPAGQAKVAKEKEPLDWKKIAGQFAEMQQSGGMGDMRAMIRLQQRLQKMTKEELASSLDEIAALDLPEQSRDMLEQMLIGPLILKDPEFVLTRFIDRLQDGRGGMGWQLSNAMLEWAKKDPPKATAWFDQQIAAGKFDSKALNGKSQSRAQFEGAIINVLLASDPDAASRRLAAMPEDQRGDVLKHHSFQQLKEENQLAFAKLVRDEVPEKEQAKTLAQQASRLVGDDGYAKVTGFMDRIAATPAERTACVEQAAESRIQSISYQKKITREDLDTLREWTKTQAPDSTDNITGKALANSIQGGRKMDFGEASELALHYQAASGNDDVLTSFLDGWPARQNKDQARVLAGKITDEKRREEILKNLR